MRFGTFDDFDRPAAGASRGQSGTRPLITGIGEDAQDERPQGACPPVEHQRRAVTILNIGGMHRDAQQEAERVDEDMALTAGDLLARIITLRVEQSPPFGAALALWLSMMAALGEASRPSRSRTAT